MASVGGTEKKGPTRPGLPYRYQAKWLGLISLHLTCQRKVTFAWCSAVLSIKLLNDQWWSIRHRKVFCSTLLRALLQQIFVDIEFGLPAFWKYLKIQNIVLKRAILTPSGRDILLAGSMVTDFKVSTKSILHPKWLALRKMLANIPFPLHYFQLNGFGYVPYSSDVCWPWSQQRGKSKFRRRFFNAK